MSKYAKLFPQPPEPEYEIATGQFTCQERGCWECVREAKYIEEINTLTWICPEGHISRIENFQ